ncbi:hypothetical protein B0H65DRAFT_504289 [Neurospora tetraspora]|uniref:Uncharacterized protein n=1 Tax=Neurospora tetraspora TaxID=94610 RepID=A0AAE0JN13_9PEZI|nr:hypothetical protein B0H65DRAFT_504289 [Neurospora tetraspora]
MKDPCCPSGKKPATEILVHITAPSRSKDDATYRALANAYLDFEPTTRTSVFSKTISPNVVVKEAVARPRPIGNGSLGPSTQPNQIIRSSGIAGFVETPVLSWRDAANNLASPSLRMRHDERHDEPSQNSQLSWQPPPSVVQDSLPDNNVTLSQFCTPTRLLEDYLHPSDSSQSLSPVIERAPRAQQSTAAPVQSQYEGDSTFPTISHISQRRQVVGHGSRVALPPPGSSFRGNSQELPVEDIQSVLSPPVNATEEPHVSAPSERGSSCYQVSRRIPTTEGSPRRQTPPDPRAKVIPLSPVVNANNKRPRPVPRGLSPSSRDSEFMIASSQPAAQEQVPPADTIISKGGPPNPSLSSPRTESEPPPTKRRRTSPEPAPAPASSSRAATSASLTSLPAPSSSANPISSSGKPLARSTSDIGPRQDAVKTHQIAQRSAHLSSVLELHSPCAPTSDHVFDLSSSSSGEKERAKTDSSLITPVLAKLATDLNLPKRYQPSLQTRALRPYERGYWLVDCTSWDRELKESCWLFLADYLGSGAAGWGVWCTRDEGFTRLRMYCWGAVVGHLYLVLYIISKRKVLYTGTEWVDGDGEVVIRMEARPRSVMAAGVGMPSAR